MNVKTVIELSEDQLRFAEALVEDGQYPSVDSVLADSLGRLMMDKAREAGADPLEGLADELRRRAALPEDQWIDMEQDNLFDRVRSRLKAREASRS